MEQKLQQQRARLMECGLGLLAAGQRAGALTPAALALAGGLAEAEVASAYADHDDYLVDLLQRLFEGAREASTLATDALPNGVARIKRGIEVYLDYNLEHPALRELLLALQTNSRGVRLNRTHTSGWTMVLELEFSALGLPHAAATAHLAIVMTVETALAEFEARRALPEFRETLYAYLDHL